MNHPSSTWQTRVLAALRGAGAPRVFSSADFQAWLATMDIDLSRRALAYNLLAWERGGVFLKVSRGLHANLLAKPVVRPDEAAHRLRAGAVVSLQRVLGQHGILNNPTDWITSVAPTGVAAGTGPAGLRTPLGLFHFTNMRPDMISRPGAAWHADAFDSSSRVPMATPEKALLDWIYLATVPSGRNIPPPPLGDVDVEGLDEARLARLAAMMGLERPLAEWLSPPSPPPPRRRGP